MAGRSASRNTRSPDAELIVGEGIESAFRLADAELFGRAGWAAVYAGGLKTLDFPRTFAPLIIAADNDVRTSAQLQRLGRVYDRWTAEAARCELRPRQTPATISTTC